MCGNEGFGPWDDALAPGVYVHQPSSLHTRKCPENTRGCQSISGKMKYNFV